MRALTYLLRSRKRIDKPAHASTNRECPYRPISNSSPQLGRRRHGGRANRCRGRCSRPNPPLDGLAYLLHPSIAPPGSAPLARSHCALYHHPHPPPLLTLDIDPPPPLEQRPARSSCEPPAARSSQPPSSYLMYAPRKPSRPLRASIRGPADPVRRHNSPKRRSHPRPTPHGRTPYTTFEGPSTEPRRGNSSRATRQGLRAILRAVRARQRPSGT